MLTTLALALVLAQEPPQWADVAGIFNAHCNGCHGPKEQKGELRLDTHELLLKGGDAGPAIVPGDAQNSLLVKLVEHRKKPVMPPANKGRKLNDAELKTLRGWLDAGAPGPKAGDAARAVEIPRITPKVLPRQAVHALAWDAKSSLLTVARPGGVDLVDVGTRTVLHRFPTARTATDLAYSSDARLLAVAGGEPGVSGEVRLWDPSSKESLGVLSGHSDAVYSLALSPDGKLLATGSYDRDVVLWDLATKKPLRTLHGHNEAVFDLAFRPDGKILASASADRTLKLWDVASGQRRDTLTESTKALHAVAWTPDGRFVLAGGVDNRIRAWEVSAEAKEGTNALRSSAFAHEGAILSIRVSADGKTVLSSADDRSVKLFNGGDYAPRHAFELQPDWPAAVSFVLNDTQVAVGRLDGSVAYYPVPTGKQGAAPAPAAKPEATALAPRGLQRGTSGEFRVAGKNLAGVSGVKSSDPRLQAKLVKAEKSDAVAISLAAAANLPPGAYEIRLASPAGETAPLKVWIDDLPQRTEKESAGATPLPSPSSVWGALAAPGDSDLYAVEAKKGETLVLDLAAKRLGSKLEGVVTLSDPSGRLVASNIDYEGESDPLVAFEVPTDGVYAVRVGDLQYGFSADHFYRLSVGRLPVVTGAWPLSVPANAESEIRLVGHNLPEPAVVRVKAGAPGELAVAVDPDRYRARKELKLAVAAEPEPVEDEPNDVPARAAPLAAGANGRIGAPGDVDLWRFEARKGVPLVLETTASRRGSPLDTRIEVLTTDGAPVPRVMLRAVRDSYLTFRPIDANAIGGRFWQWEEMDLNQLLYLQGEVVKLFLAPRGPDSQWDFFALGGKRVTYFDTSATAHALDEPAYIVEPHPPGTLLPANGLPTFTLPYQNDDDAMRRLGSDSRLVFSAPADGAYLVRVRDARGHGGERYAYRLSLREAKPDFAVTFDGLNASVPAGSGRQFAVRVDRLDGFEGAVRVDFENLPPGFRVTTPVTIEPGHFFSNATLWADPDAPKPTKENAGASKAAARASIGGREVVHDLKGLGALSLAEAPKVRVQLLPVDGAAEIAVVPGKETAALLRIERSGFNERVTFDVEGLPFGVIVSDIGLNGVLIPEKETERRIFLSCAPWVAAQTRPCHARAREVGNPTSPPVPFTVRAK